MAAQPEADLIKLAQSVKQMRDSMPAILEFIELQSKQQRKKYLSLIAEGFTKDEALVLVSNFKLL